MVPTMQDSSIILQQDKNNKDLEKIIQEESKKNNIPFLNTEKDFLSFFSEENEFPFGFNNTKPGTGHLNKNGHKIIANILYEFLIKKNNY